MDGRNSFSSTSVFFKTENNPDGTKCGLFNCYPNGLQKFASPKTFLICFCVKNILQGMIFTYLVGIETSLERHFQFDGKSIGLLLTLGELGPILTVIIFAQLGSMGNRPRWMASGLLLISLALLMCSGMNFIFPPPTLPESQLEANSSLRGNNDTSKMICKTTYDHDSLISPNTSAMLPLDTVLSNCQEDSTRRKWAFAAWVLIYSLLGIGGTTVYVIGAPYLDDSIDKKDSPLYFAITIAVRMIGPVFGYFLSSACLKLYVEITKKPNWVSSDPRWIGAWWLGSLILAFLIAVFAMVVGSFPRNLGNQQRDNNKPTTTEDSNTHSTLTLEIAENLPSNSNQQKIKELKSALLRLLRNPVLLCSCASSVFTILGLAGYFIWLPKFFEHEFRISKSTSALYSGLSGNVTMIFGVLVSGWWYSKYQPHARRVAALVAATKFVYSLGLLLVMLAHCGFTGDLPGTVQKDGSLALQAACNKECNCDTTEFSYSPVCLRGDFGQKTFFSPCYAGCSAFSDTNSSIQYHSCKCELEARSATPGFCTGTCSNIYIYMALLAVIKFIVSFSTVGNLLIDLRCVEEKDKALALGLLAAIGGLLGFLPNPIIYGSLIDSSCLVWEKSPCGKNLSCWVYDTDMFRYKLHGMTSACVTIAGVFEVITYLKVKDLQLFKNENTN